MDEHDLLKAERGSVVAPAGCGKTELIARAVRAMSKERALVLTHTHAGVKALRDRMKRLGVGREQAHVETIAGWCLRYAAAYPLTSKLSSTQPAGKQWNEVYSGARELLGRRAIRAVVEATYARAFVDEYQDCTATQHAIVEKLADVVPTAVLGDPLQGIFGFAGATLSWTSAVETTFKPLGTLATAWRWKGKNEALGEWLLSIRGALSSGQTIDLSNAPITWRASTAENQRREAFTLLKSKGQIVAIRKWAKDAHAFARAVGGVFASMEEMDCADLLKLAEELDTLTGFARAARVLRFAAECWTEVSSALEALQRALDESRAPALRAAKLLPIAHAFHRAATSGEWDDLRDAMKALEHTPGAHLYRRELWREALKAISEIAIGARPSLRDTAWQLRNRARYVGRAVEPRSVSRTLLIKGLEFDHALVLNADEFEDAKQPGDGARHFYVAVTRGASSLTVLSQRETIKFAAPRL